MEKEIKRRSFIKTSSAFAFGLSAIKPEFSSFTVSDSRGKLPEIRALVESILFAKADLYPDYKAEILTVRLNSLSTPRCNKAVTEICQTLNDYELVFPGIDLRLFFKIAILTPARDQEL